MEVYKLKDFATVSSGNSAPQEKRFFKGGENYFIRTSDVGKIKKGVIYKSRDLLTNEAASKMRFLRKGTILFPKSGASTFLNHRVIMECSGYASSHLATITGNTQIVTDKYLLYYLYTIDARDLIQDSNYPSVRLTEIKEIQIPVPSLAIQNAIVSKLDQAFEAIDQAIANTEKNIYESGNLKQSVLNEFFNFEKDQVEMLTLEEVSTYFGRGKSKHRPRNDKSLFGGNYPFIQTGDVRNSDHQITTFSSTYNEIGLAQSKLWPSGTVCITIAANIAETAILNFSACFPDSIIGIIPDEEKANSDYIEYMLQHYQLHLKSLSKGSAQENINLKTFAGKAFPFPSLKEQEAIQKKISQALTQIESFKKNQLQKITLLNELKMSILEKAFKGELI